MRVMPCSIATWKSVRGGATAAVLAEKASCSDAIFWARWRGPPSRYVPLNFLCEPG